jgi:hypothetical protein
MRRLVRWSWLAPDFRGRSLLLCGWIFSDITNNGFATMKTILFDQQLGEDITLFKKFK